MMRLRTLAVLPLLFVAACSTTGEPEARPIELLYYVNGFEGQAFEVVTDAAGCEAPAGQYAAPIMGFQAPNAQHLLTGRVFETLRAGARGYLLKDASPVELPRVLREALAGGAPLSPVIARMVVSSFAEAPSDPYDALWLKSAIARLKPALRDTVVLVAGQQLTHAEAAEILGVAENTVAWRMHEVRRILSSEK